MRVSIILFLCFCFTACAQKKQYNRILLTVKRNYTIPKKDEQVTIAIALDQLSKQIPAIKKSSVVVLDQNFGKEVSARIVDSNADKRADYLVLDLTFESNEPVFAFLIKPSNQKQELIQEEILVDDRFELNWLTPLPDYEKQNGKIQDVASKLIQSTINMYPDLKDFPVYAPHRWNYEYSFFMAGTYLHGEKIGNTSFTSYAQHWIDNFISDEGRFKPGVYKMEEYKLDDILPGRLVLYLHEATRQAKYKSIADTLMLHLQQQPKTSDGGYWHKEIYPYQMWLDGIFMADVFSIQYAKAYNQPEWFDEAVHQIKLIYQHTVDDKTGLLYHGWDESKNPVWAHPERGTSPEFWGRAVGWYLMALVEVLDYLPENHPERKDVIQILQELSASVLKVQDAKTGLWYQVMDKADQPGNWIETSCSAMFAYAFAKGHQQGFLDTTYLKAAKHAYQAILNDYVYADADDNLHLDQTVKIGTLNPKNSKGDFGYYITTERRINDYKGLAALLYASMLLQ